MIVSTAALCLAINIFMESRGEPIPGQYAVALVTMNRAKQDPERVCAEVFEAKQFSWTISGAKKVKGGWKVATPTDAHAWWVAQRIAEVTLSGRMYDITDGSKFFHTTAVRPYWVASMRKTKRIGGHIFYTAVSQS
jgi:spore germination cell wall hydrolase CwlJ-like protein